MSFKDGFRSGYRVGGAIVSAIVGIVTLLAGGSMGMRSISPKRQRKETIKLYNDVKALYEASPLSKTGLEDIAVQLATEACVRAEREPAVLVLESMYEAIVSLLVEEGLRSPPDIDWSLDLGLEDEVNLRNFLNARKRFLGDFETYFDFWSEKIIRVFEMILGYFPEGTIADEGADTNGGQSFKTALIEVSENPAMLIEHILVIMGDEKIGEMNLFESTLDCLNKNILLASGIDPQEQYKTTKSYILPTEAKGKTAAELARLYLGGTAFVQFLGFRCAFRIPLHARFEHCHIVGGSGHGKTQLLQLLIHDDLLRARDDKVALCVIDSHGDLINTISHLAYFSPTASGNLAEKLVLIDPNDTAYPVCLNMFDMNLERVNRLSEVDRERTLNATVELYEYMFGALLGAELTQRQGVIFKYLARLMMVIPGATVHTLRALMEDGTPFRPYIERLEGTTRAFFETQFFGKSFDATKKQILTRLWGVLSNATFDRMFSHERNKVDLYEAMNSGKVVLINTAKDLLQKDGCQILGRFFIAMIGQAALQRAAIPEEDRRPCIVYIDEAHDYFDEHIEDLLNQARKYRVGITLAHQNLDQLSARLSATIMASTSIKLAGGVSDKDARAFAKEMQCTPEFIRNMKKTKSQTAFACWVRNLTHQPIKITVPLGAVERKPVIKEADYRKLVSLNRERIAAPRVALQETWLRTEKPILETTAERKELRLVEKEEIALEAEHVAHKPPKAEPAVLQIPPEVPVLRAVEKRTKRAQIEPLPLGRGGKEHKYLQGIIKQIAQDRGYRAIIEKPVLEGSGSVDVSLEKDGTSIACEISVTTAPEQELGNIEKCLAAGYDQVLLLSSDKKHINNLKKFVASALEQEQLNKVFFFLPDDFIDYLSELETPEPTEQTVRGYKVKVAYQPLTEAEKMSRRKAIANTILQSVRRMKEVRR